MFISLYYIYYNLLVIYLRTKSLTRRDFLRIGSIGLMTPFFSKLNAKTPVYDYPSGRLSQRFDEYYSSKYRQESRYVVNKKSFLGNYCIRLYEKIWVDIKGKNIGISFDGYKTEKKHSDPRSEELALSAKLSTFDPNHITILTTDQPIGSTIEITISGKKIAARPLELLFSDPTILPMADGAYYNSNVPAHIDAVCIMQLYCVG